MDFKVGDIVQVMHREHDNLTTDYWSLDSLNYQGYIGQVRSIRDNNQIALGLMTAVPQHWLRKLPGAQSTSPIENYPVGTKVRISVNPRLLQEQTTAVMQHNGKTATVIDRYGLERYILDIAPELRFPFHWLHITPVLTANYFIDDLYHYDRSIHCPKVVVQVREITPEGLFIYPHPDHPDLSRWRLDPARFSRIPLPTGDILIKNTNGDIAVMGTLTGRVHRRRTDDVLLYHVRYGGHQDWYPGDDLYVLNTEYDSIPAVGEDVVVLINPDGTLDQNPGRASADPFQLAYIDTMTDYQGHISTLTSFDEQIQAGTIAADHGQHYWHKQWITGFSRIEL